MVDTAFFLIVDGIIVQKQPYPGAGFIELPASYVCGQINNGDGTFRNPDVGETPQPAPMPFLYAVGNLQVADQEISGIETSVNFSAAVWLDVGSYLVLFSETQASTSFLAKAYSGTCQALIVEKADDYLHISATDGSGTPFDPAEFSIEVIRINNNG